MDVDAFARCVRSSDSESLIRLPGVGRKTAERLIVEMRDRVGDTPTAAPAPVSPVEPQVDPVHDAVRALIALGYKPQEASRMVNRIEARGQSREEIIRLALKASLA
jgi:Holliday junction DNA helicase RuvA